MIDLDSLIGAATRVQGNLVFRGGLRIDGEVVGNVVAEPGFSSYLVIAERARVEGEIRCDHLVVNGEVKGCVFSGALLEIQPSGRIMGDVSYNVLEMHGGAQVLGTLTHRDSSGVEPLLAVSGA